MPGSNARALEKARGLPADGLILDLEDAVAPAAKVSAREQVRAAVAAGAYGHREVVIRVNGPGTDWGQADIEMAATSGADAVLFPKIDDAEALRRAVGLLRDCGAPASQAAWAMAETARGILNIQAIAAADPALEVIVMGTSDLGRELRLPPDDGRAGLLPALGLCVLAARAEGLDILDGVHVDLADVSGFGTACRQGRALGFDGKTLVHPGQIETANAVFGVSAEDIERATEIVAAWESAESDGRGIAVVDGRMIEKLHADDARRVLALSAAVRAGESREQEE